MWTQFMDMHSGGGRKESFDVCYIEAAEEEAKVVFFNRFGHSPNRVSCTCCGEDYSVSEHETLEQATAYNRGCKFSKEENCYIEERATEVGFYSYQPLETYREQKDVCIIPEVDIVNEERKGEVPEQGYVWQD